VAARTRYESAREVQDDCAAGQRVIEDRLGLCEAGLGIVPAPCPPFEVGERRQQQQRKLHQAALPDELVVLAPKHLAGSIELARPEQARADRDRRRHLPWRHPPEALRSEQRFVVQFGRGPAHRGLVERERSGRRRDQRRVVQLERDPVCLA
jgi:hypothetical protein